MGEICISFLLPRKGTGAVRCIGFKNDNAEGHIIITYPILHFLKGHTPPMPGKAKIDYLCACARTEKQWILPLDFPADSFNHCITSSVELRDESRPGI